MSYNVNGAKSDMYPEAIRVEQVGPERKGRSCTEKCCIVIAVLLFLAAAALAALFTIYYLKDKDNDNDKSGDGIAACSSKNCVMAASKSAIKMDPKMDPCQDFAQYACGQFYKDTVIPDDKVQVSAMSVLGDANMKILRRILTGPTQPDLPGYVKKMKAFYSTCMDVDAIEKIGLEPYKLDPIGRRWPTINPFVPLYTQSLKDLIVDYERVSIEFLFMWTIETDMEDSSKHKLALVQTSLGLDLKYMKRPRNDPAILAYQQYYVDVAVALGADPTTAQADAMAVVDFERELAKIMVTREESIDLATVNNPTTFQKMAEDYPYIDWQRAVQAAFQSVGITIPMDMAIINKNPKYFDKLGGVLRNTNMRVILNEFGFLYANSRVGGLTKQMREIRAKYFKVITGTQADPPRWQNCLGDTAGTFRDSVSKRFVEEQFPEESKKYMKTLVANLKTSFRGILKEAAWMSPKTKKAAYLKLKDMKIKIGYPDTKFSNDDIEKKYENYTVVNGQYYTTIQQNRMVGAMEYLRTLHKPVDKEKWGMGAYEVNAYYRPDYNEIVFPAGILQSPYFSAESPSSMNYGAIGMVIGHEITHGFDQDGSQYDHAGNVKNWWQPRDLEEYKNRTQCVIDQYSAYRAESVGLNVNGKLTAGENVGDSGGLKEAYRAYKTYAASQPEELPLPGLGLTTDQQFFLAFSQVWCTKSRDAALKNNILTNEHSPDMFRIKGALQNSEDFARVYKCPKGSPMNPVKKCSVW